VTWYEAVRFCEWLTERIANSEWRMTTDRPGSSDPPQIVTLAHLAAQSKIQNQQSKIEVRLPSEAEWEKAARGGLQVPLPQHRYPWGDEPDPERANYSDTGIGDTSAVGCFPQGCSVYAVEEMSGNVWEWCATIWQDNYQGYKNDNDLKRTDAPRVLRGGAFSDTLRGVRCAVRLRYYPSYRDWDLGFRVMVSPLLASDL